MLRELQRAVGKGPGVAGECRQVHGIRPTIRLVVKGIVIAHRSNISPASALKDRSLAKRRSVVRGRPVDGEPFSLHGRDSPLFKCVVGSLNEIGLARCTDVGAKLDEGERTFGQVPTILEIGLSAEPTQLMTTHRREKAITRRLFRTQEADRFKPASDSAAALAGALPPTTARGRYDQRRQTGIAARSFGNNIECLRQSPLDVGNEGNFGTLLRLRLEPFSFCARNL